MWGAGVVQEVLGQRMAKFWKETSDVMRILWDGCRELKEAVMLKASAMSPERQGHPRDCWSHQRLHQH